MGTLKRITITAVWGLTLYIVSAGLLCADAPTINQGDIHPKFDPKPRITLNCSSIELGNTIP